MNEVSLGFAKCTTCKKDIPYGQKYYVCNVTTCNQKRNNYVFCSVGCWDAHVPLMRHKDSWAEEKMAPRRIISPTNSTVIKTEPDILVVTTKVKSYIKDRADMNTSDKIMEILSEKIRRLCDDAIDQARAEGRKTVLDRDMYGSSEN